ncbi:hypothetical protein PJP14_29515, partial [Mycobacterium kansasii]
ASSKARLTVIGAPTQTGISLSLNLSQSQYRLKRFGDLGIWGFRDASFMQFCGFLFRRLDLLLLLLIAFVVSQLISLKAL